MEPAGEWFPQGGQWRSSSVSRHSGSLLRFDVAPAMHRVVVVALVLSSHEAGRSPLRRTVATVGAALHGNMRRVVDGMADGPNAYKPALGPAVDIGILSTNKAFSKHGNQRLDAGIAPGDRWESGTRSLRRQLTGCWTRGVVSLIPFGGRFGVLHRPYYY